MTEKEDFLSRWSRRKQDASRETKPAPEDKAPPPPAPASGTQQAALVQGKPDHEPLFDLAKLPSLDSIGASTDIRMFMQPGVPASLTRAALRRAWSADPSIRDFIGLSENAWDFTTPESITGFGELLPIDDVKQMLSQLLPDKTEQGSEVRAAEHPASQNSPEANEQTSEVPQAAPENQEFLAANTVVQTDTESILQGTQNDLASQQERPAVDTGPAVTKRRHGGALPT
jgi:hypothetical protein